MKHWTIKRRIFCGFGVITLAAVALGIFAFTQLRVILSRAIHITDDSLPGIYEAGQLAEKIQFFGNQNSTLALKSLISKNEDLKSDRR